MPSEPTAAATRRALQRLGAGGRDDRLGFRLVLRLLWRCLPWLRAVRGHLAALVASAALCAVSFVPIALLLFDVIWNRVLNGEAPTPLEARCLLLDPALAVAGAPSAALRHSMALRALLAMGGVGLVYVPLLLGLWYYQVWILQRINQRLRVDLLERYQALSLRFHAESRIGDAIYRLYQDSAMVTQLIDVLFLTPLFAGGRFLVGLAVVALFDPRLALLLAAVWPPCLLLGAWFSRRLRRGFRASREATSELVSRIQETIVGIQVIKAYGAEAREQERFERASRAAFDAAFRARSLFAVYSVTAFALLGLALLAASGLAAWATREGAALQGGAWLAGFGFGAWNLGLYNFFKVRFGDGTSAAHLLMRTWGRVQDVGIGLDRVFEVLDLEPEVKDAPDAVELPPLRDRVTFRGVGFQWEPGRPALSGIDLEARAGSITAIVGPTGAGKSTLVSLLLRLFDPEAGAITIDGLDLRRVRLASLRARVAIALQENVLFGTTVRENIRYGAPDADDAAVRAAARVSCADEFIEALPDGYDTLLGERGTRLSSGQRQRLSIARAVLKDPSILILDEPTAALDAETELEVLQRLAAWARGRAVFLITHRLSTIRRADRVVVLQEGRIVEQGSHEELLARPLGAYRRMVEAEEAAALRAPAAAGSRA